MNSQEKNDQESKGKFIFLRIPEALNSDKNCPKCGENKLTWGSISCPDKRIGCLVAHFGYTCLHCGESFN